MHLCSISLSVSWTYVCIRYPYRKAGISYMSVHKFAVSIPELPAAASLKFNLLSEPSLEVSRNRSTFYWKFNRHFHMQAELLSRSVSNMDQHSLVINANRDQHHYIVTFTLFYPHICTWNSAVAPKSIKGPTPCHQNFYCSIGVFQLQYLALIFLFPKTQFHFILDLREQNCWVSFLTAVLWL